VTHDQDEALIMSDRIAVLSQGRIEQVGAPEDLYERPRTRFVADFLAVKNLVEASVADVSGGKATLRTPAGLTLLATDDGGYVAGAAVSIGIRPERLRLDDVAGTAGPHALAGVLEDEIYLGDSTEWHVRLGELLLVVAEDAVRARNRRRGEAVLVSFDPSAVLRLEADP
jgi:spermidine/putrescine transport system ATP-binding protein